jgi:DNA-binding SARP family transcriptional activator
MRAITAVGGLLLRLLKLVLLLGLLAGIPAGLITQIGWPLPRQLPTLDTLKHALTAPVSDTAVLDLLAVALWILWAAFVASLLVEIAAAVAGTPAPRIPGLSPMQPLAAWLVAGLTATVLASTVPAASGAVVAPVPARPAAAIGMTTLTAATQHTGPTSTSLAASGVDGRGAALVSSTAAGVRPQLLVYEVRHDDWLGVIAERFLGDFDRYHDIQRLNPDLIEDPNLIQPKWRLILPGDAYDRGVRAHATGHLIVKPPASNPPTVVPNPAPPSVDPAPSAPAPASPSPPRSPPATPDSSAASSARPSSSASPAASSAPPSPANAAASPSAARSAPSPPGSGAGAGRADRPAPSVRRGVGVHLPGGWVPIPLAAALVAAAAMVWLRRRHRYVPGKLAGSVLLDPDLRPLPPAVTVLRRGVRRHAPDLLPAPPEPDEASTREAAGAVHLPDLHSSGVDAATSNEAVSPIGPSGPDLAGLGTPLPTGGLGLVGDGAYAAARAMLVATLSSGSPEDPDARGQVVIPVDALTTLLGVDAVNLHPTPRLTVTANLGEALTRLDELLIERRRTLQDEDADDLESMRAADPMHPPMPPVLLLAEVPEPQSRARLTTTLHLGTQLQINAVLLGDWPRGDTLDVDTEGYTDTEDSETGDRDRLAVLDTPTTLQLLQMLAEAHTGKPSAGPQPEAVGPSTMDDAGSSPVPVDASPDLDLPDSGSAPQPAQPPTPVATPPTAPQQNAGTTAAGSTAATDHAGTRRARVVVRVLGRPGLVTTDPPKQELRRRALELLVYLAVHRGGANLPDIKEAFWPDASNRRAGERLQTEVGDLRGRIRDAYHASDKDTDQDQDKDEQVQPVINTGGRYHLNPDLVDIDWWTVQDALAAAITDTSHQMQHLRRAVDAFHGPLADGCTYDWLPDVEEHVRRQGIIAYTQLAQLVADTDPTEAARWLDQATTLDPINEELARTAMRAHARIQDADAVRAQLHRIRAALDEIDLEPDEQTITLATDLLRQIAAHRGKPPGPGEEPPQP